LPQQPVGLEAPEDTAWLENTPIFVLRLLFFPLRHTSTELSAGAKGKQARKARKADKRSFISTSASYFQTIPLHRKSPNQQSDNLPSTWDEITPRPCKLCAFLSKGVRARIQKWLKRLFCPIGAKPD
jgi:hypothetical protein